MIALNKYTDADELLAAFGGNYRKTSIAWRPHLELFVTLYVVTQQKDLKDLADIFGISDANFKRIRRNTTYKTGLPYAGVENFLQSLGMRRANKILSGKASRAVLSNLERFGFVDLSPTEDVVWSEMQDRVFRAWCADRRLAPSGIYPTKSIADPRNLPRRIAGLSLYRLAFNMYRQEQTALAPWAGLRLGKAEKKLLRGWIGDQIHDGIFPLRPAWTENMKDLIRQECRAAALTQTRAVEAMGYKDSTFDVLDSKGYVEFHRLAGLAKVLVARRQEYQIEREVFGRSQRAVLSAKQTMADFDSRPRVPLHDLDPRVSAIVRAFLPSNLVSNYRVPGVLVWGVAGAEKLHRVLEISGISISSLGPLQRSLYKFTQTGSPKTLISTELLIKVAMMLAAKERANGRPPSVSPVGARAAYPIPGF